MPPKFIRYAAYSSPKMAMTAYTGAPSPSSAAFAGASALASIGPTDVKNQMAAERPVRATTARLMAETIFKSAAPKGFCAALSSRRKKPVTASTAARTAGRNSLPTVICTLSQADPSPRSDPASVSFIRAAISAAEPPPAASCRA